MLFLELLKWKSVILALFMSLLWQLSFAIGYNTPFWHETEGCYFVQYLNDERNRCKDEENYFFADRRNVYCYSFEDETQTVCVSTEGTDKRIEDFAVWEDDVYYVTSLRSDDKEYIWEMCRIDYQSKEQEVVLTNEDFNHLNQEEVVEYAGVDVHKGYLFFYINRDNEYICPLGEDAGENSVKLLSLFDKEGTVGEIQQVEYDGITIEREVLSQGRYDITGIWDDQGYKILYSGAANRIAVGDEWIRLKREDRPHGFWYKPEDDDSWGWKAIIAFGNEKFELSYISDDYMEVEDDRIIGLLLVPFRWEAYKITRQYDLKKSVLYELNPKTGESQILFDTRTNRTTIIGYKDKNLYYINNEKIYVEDMETKEKTVLGEIPKGKDYIIDWQGGYLIIREDFTYGQNGDMVLVYEAE